MAFIHGQEEAVAFEAFEPWQRRRGGRAHKRALHGGGPSLDDGTSPSGDALVEKAHGTEVLVASVPFNANKADEYIGKRPVAGLKRKALVLRPR